MWTWLKRKLHQHDYQDRYESWYLHNGDLVMVRQYVCSCGHKHTPQALLVATKEQLDEAYNNRI